MSTWKIFNIVASATVRYSKMCISHKCDLRIHWKFGNKLKFCLYLLNYVITIALMITNCKCPDLIWVFYQKVYYEYSPQQVWGWLWRAWYWLDDCLPVIFRNVRYPYTVLRIKIILIDWSHDIISCFLYMCKLLSVKFRTMLVPCTLAGSLSGPKSQGTSVIPYWKSVQDLTNQEQACRNRPHTCCGEYS